MQWVMQDWCFVQGCWVKIMFCARMLSQDYVLCKDVESRLCFVQGCWVLTKITYRTLMDITKHKIKLMWMYITTTKITLFLGIIK